MVARHVRVTGRVQGVFFRGWTAEQARALSVTGWVRNCADGSVEAHVEGEEQAVSAMIDRMRSGPAGAIVADLVTEAAAPDDATNFEVRH